MSDWPETLAAILAEMREAGRSDEHADGPLIEDYADRIEAAAEREQADLADAHDAIARLETELAEARRERDSCAAENSLLARAPGNAAALREALNILEKLDYAIPYVYQNRSPQNELARLVRMAENKVREVLKGE